MRFVHAADLHLDSPLRGLERYEGAPVREIQSATRRALIDLVSFCLEERIDLLVLAGDLFDGDWRDYSTGLFFAAQMSRLRETGIPVALIRGNHDAASQITKHLELPANVIELATDRPETHVLDGLGVAIHGQGFATKAVDRDLAAGYPDPVSGAFNLGLLHTSLDGRPGHHPYAPTSKSVLAERGYDYWALGHVHGFEHVSSTPHIVFSGNLQGRHARETGPKGAVVVEVDGGRVQSLAHRAFDVVRWQHLEVDLSCCGPGLEPRDAIYEALAVEAAAADGRTLAARLTLTGTTEFHRSLVEEREHWESQVRAIANDVTGDMVWIEKVVFRTRSPVPLCDLRERRDAVGQLARAMASLRDDPKATQELAESLSALVRSLPREARESEDGVRLTDPAVLLGLLDDVEDMLLPLVLEEVAE